MLPCHNLWDLEEQRGRGFLNLSYGGKGKCHKQEKLLWCKKIYALHSKNSETLIYLNKKIKKIQKLSLSIANTFFQLNLVFITDSRAGFRSGLLWKCELNVRSSHWSCSAKKSVPKNFANFTGKHLCWGLLLLKPSGLQFYKGCLQHRHFPVEFAKF